MCNERRKRGAKRGAKRRGANGVDQRLVIITPARHRLRRYDREKPGETFSGREHLSLSALGVTPGRRDLLFEAKQEGGAEFEEVRTCEGRCDEALRFFCLLKE